LPETAYLKFIALGHDGLISDLVLAKALTYFGSHYQQRRHFSFKHLKKLFKTAIEMDPLNKEAILLAGNVLSDIDVNDAIDILKLGMTYHPRYWKFPEMIGYHYFFRLNDSLNAGKYYEIAAKLPDHPPYVPSLSGKFYQESGRYEEAIRVLNNFYITTEDKRLKQSFADSIKAIEEKIKTRDFMLKAKVIRVIAANEIEIQPDPMNPQFQSLPQKIGFIISGHQPFSLQANDKRQSLLARFQENYTQMVLAPGSDIGIHFERDNNGQLIRDDSQRFKGKIILKNDREFKLLEINSFPPKPTELDLETIHQLPGKVVSLTFKIHHIGFTGTGILLHSAADYRNKFSVYVPHEFVTLFGQPGGDRFQFFRDLTGKSITVSGLLLVNKESKRYQVTLYSPLQLTLFH
jgi:tetratricopeptide (TPR) repeat protein